MLDHPPQALAAAKDRRRPAGRLAERLDLHPIAPHQPDESQGGRKLHGVAELGRFAEIHRGAGVDQGVEMKILLFQEHLQEELFQPRVGVPIDEPQVVARHIVAEVGELDALALPRAAAFAFHPPAENLPAHQLEFFKLGQEFRR